MPTARPSISARAGVALFMSTHWVSAMAPPTPTPTPTRAISSGSPAASRPPSITRSTTAATAIPMASVAPTTLEMSCTIAWEYSMLTPVPAS